MAKAFAPKRVSWAQAYNNRPTFFRRCISHPQVIISAAQGIEIIASSIGVWMLAQSGFSPVELLIIGKIELFFLSVPMHILTLHLASRGH